MARTGRPRKLDANDPEILQKVEDMAATGLAKYEIALCIGLGKTHIHDYEKNFPEFAKAIKRGQARGIKAVTNALFENAMKGNTVAQIFFLKNRSKDQWKDRPDEQKINGFDFSKEDLEKLTTEELEALRSITKKLAVSKDAKQP